MVRVRNGINFRFESAQPPWRCVEVIRNPLFLISEMHRGDYRRAVGSPNRIAAAKIPKIACPKLLDQEAGIGRCDRRGTGTDDPNRPFSPPGDQAVRTDLYAIDRTGPEAARTLELHEIARLRIGGRQTGRSL